MAMSYDELDSLVDGPVELLSWPRDAARRSTLARLGVPRVLLVEPDAEPPVEIGLDEDWIRLPADDRDVRARIAHLARFASRLDDDQPFIDAHHILHRAGATLPLSGTEAAVLQMLLDRRGSVVAVDELRREAWHGQQPPTRDAVDALIYRLRRRLSGWNLVIRSVRNRGFVIDTVRAV
jgi:DNA-binding response OmpR family regulator